MMALLVGSKLRDAGMISSAQKLLHYTIAAYGTAAALAGQLDLREEQRILHDALEEEKAADAALTAIAKRAVNPDAAATAAAHTGVVGATPGGGGGGGNRS